MSDDLKEPESQAAESTRPDEDEDNDLREVSEDELKDILAAHKDWLESGGKDGKQADLRKADLHGIHLWSVDLQSAFLWKADLEGTSFKDTNLQGCDLRRANLCGASFLEGVIIRDAQLQDANLLDVKGLLGHQLAGTNVSGAKLPPDIAKFEGLEHVTEISKHARNIFLAVIGGCVFSWLTIATTTDVALLTNTASTPLPIIQTKVPIAGFYFAAPLILLSLYIYLHMYLQRLWSGLAGLPAIFPDGRTLDERAYPWLLTSLVGKYVPRLKEDRPPFSRQQVFLSILTAWCLVPLTIGWFWLRYLPVHDWITGVHVTLVALAVTHGVGYFWRARATLRGRQLPKITWKIWRSPVHYAHVALFLGLLAAASVVSVGAIEGKPGGHKLDPRTWIPSLFEFVDYRTHADLFEEQVSTRPEDWWRANDKQERELKGIKGANLRGRNLRHASARGAFLAKANLHKANLEGADLEFANLQKADLSDAKLRDAKLTGANLQGANLIKAKLRGAVLHGANLKGASLNGVNLQGVILSGVNLQGAILAGANLQKAGLARVNLQEASLGGAKLKEADLREADLREADLREADLREADLQGAILESANLRGADLRGADLRLAKGLMQEQLDKACGDTKTRLPEYLKDYRMKPCPAQSD